MNLKCKRCKNQAKLDSDFCTPCQKNLDGLCAKKNCNNSINTDGSIKSTGILCIDCLKISKQNKFQEKAISSKQNKLLSSHEEKEHYSTTSYGLGETVIIISLIGLFLSTGFENVDLFYGFCLLFVLGLLLLGILQKDSEDVTVENQRSDTTGLNVNQINNFGDLFEEINSEIGCSRCKRINCICITVEIIGSCRRCGTDLTISNSIGIDGHCTSCYDHGEDI